MLTALAVLALGGAALAAYVAWDQRTPVATGAAVALGVLAWLLRAARALVPGTEVSIEDGVLRIVRGPSRHQFPLTGTHPPIDVLGAPGERGWKVLIQRKGMKPFVVTRSMVDPAAFTEVLRHYRPHA